MSWFWTIYFLIAIGFAVWMARHRERYVSTGRRSVLALAWPVILYKMVTDAGKGASGRGAGPEPLGRRVEDGDEPPSEVFEIPRYGPIDDDDG